jgi:hypothetical protein
MPSKSKTQGDELIPECRIDSAPPNNALIGIAGVHYVVSELSRRGLVALPTIRNTAAYDVVVVTTDGTRHANIQVKTSSKKVSFFRMPASDRVMAGPRDFYVLLRWDERAGNYDGLMLTGKEAHAEVCAAEESQRKRITAGTRNVLVPCVWIAGYAAKKAAAWRRRWAGWRL